MKYLFLPVFQEVQIFSILFIPSLQRSQLRSFVDSVNNRVGLS